eukprot:c27376_g3_i4 orf=235-492(+)
MLPPLVMQKIMQKISALLCMLLIDYCMQDLTLMSINCAPMLPCKLALLASTWMPPQHSPLSLDRLLKSFSEILIFLFVQRLCEYI